MSQQSKRMFLSFIGLTFGCILHLNFSNCQVFGQPKLQRQWGLGDVAAKFDQKERVLTIHNKSQFPLKNYLLSIAIPKDMLPTPSDKNFWFGELEAKSSSENKTRDPVQFGKPWLMDSAKDKDVVRLTSVIENVPAKSVLKLRLMSDSKKTETQQSFQFSGPNDTRSLHYKGTQVLKLMGIAYNPKIKAEREKTYKVFHHVGLPGVKEFLTKGAGGLFSHHRGIFYGFNQIRYSDKKTDYKIDTWHASGAYQKLEKVVLEEAGPVFGRQVVEIHWVNEKKVPAEVFAVEHRQIVVVPQADHMALDISSSLRTVEFPIDLKGDPQHAGFQFRASQKVATESKADTYYLRPDGMGEKTKFRNWPNNKKHINLPFHGMHFRLGDARLAVLRLDQSSNPRPSRFSERDYGRFGCYFEHLLKPNQPLNIQYRLLIKKGEFQLDEAKSWHRQFQSSRIALPNFGEAKKSDPNKNLQIGALKERGNSNRWNSEGWDVRVEESKGKTVFSPSTKGSWDSAMRERGWIVRKNGQWELFYTGYDGTRKGIKRLGAASSTDGWKWTRLEKPLIDDLWVEDMHVVDDPDNKETTAWMFAEGKMDQAHLLRRDRNGKWSSVGVLDIRMTDGSPISKGPRGTPTAFFNDGQWYLFYERYDQGIWLAKLAEAKKSGDSENQNDPKRMLRWINVKDKPVIGLGFHSFNSRMVALNQIVKVPGGYLAMMHSSGSKSKPRKWCCCVAFSSDLLHWKYRPTPVTDPENNRSSGSLVKQGNGDWAFFTTHGKVERFPAKLIRAAKD